MNEKKRGYLKISKSWGECNCGCGRIIAPPGLMCIVKGFFFIATHESRVSDDFYEDFSQSNQTKEANMATAKKKVLLTAAKSTEQAEAASTPVVAKKKAVVKKNDSPVEKKAVLPKEPKAAKPVKEKAPKVPRITANSLCRELLLERKYTDDQIVAKIKEVFPDSKFTNIYVSTTRVDLNKGYYKNCIVKEPIPTWVEKDGKVVPSEEIKKDRDAARAAKRTELAEKKKVVAPEASAAKKKLPIKKEEEEVQG